MAGQGHGYRDYLSQSASSSLGGTWFASPAAATDADDSAFHPDAPASSSLHTPRAHLSNLDLNSQVDVFPYLDSYSSYLHCDEARGEQALPPRPAGGGGTTGGGGLSAFQPPRPAGGERPNGQMTGRGYKKIQKKFREKTGLYHEIRQFKNRWTQCRSLWTFHEMTLNKTGLGRNPNGTVIADDDRWKKHTKKRPECKKFRKFIPTYIDFLQEMYQGWTVDGQSSCIPGETLDGDEDADGEEEGDQSDEDMRVNNSPMSFNSRKRGSHSTTSTANSPSKKHKNTAAMSPAKKHKNPMLKAMKGLIDTIQTGNTQEQNNLKMASEQKMLEQQQADEEIRSCLRMAKECGATEESDEYYAATKLFEKKYNRTVFSEFTTSAGKLGWLRRFCQFGSV
ncbi:hypothetical protein ABZP36_022321 [Zizania latifolia]